LVDESISPKKSAVILVDRQNKKKLKIKLIYSVQCSLGMTSS